MAYFYAFSSFPKEWPDLPFEFSESIFYTIEDIWFLT